MIRFTTRIDSEESLSTAVHRDMHDEIQDMMQFGGDFGEVSERNYMFQKPEEENIDARIDTPSRLELGCPTYSSSQDRFAASLGFTVPETTVSTPQVPTE